MHPTFFIYEFEINFSNNSGSETTHQSSCPLLGYGTYHEFVTLFRLCYPHITSMTRLSS